MKTGKKTKTKNKAKVFWMYLWISGFADAKVAHADLGKDARRTVPALAVDDLVDELEAEHVKVVAEHHIEHKELAHAVADEHELGEQVEHHEIVAQELAAARAKARAREHTPDEQRASSQQRRGPGRGCCRRRFAASTRVVHVLVHGADHVAHVLGAALVLLHRLVVARRLDNVAHVEARAARQRAPRYVRNVEEERLREQYEGNLR